MNRKSSAETIAYMLQEEEQSDDMDELLGLCTGGMEEIDSLDDSLSLSLVIQEIEDEASHDEFKSGDSSDEDEPMSPSMLRVEPAEPAELDAGPSDEGPTTSAESSSRREVFLLTWSQADLATCPSRERFAEMITDAFRVCSRGGTDDITMWSVGLEPHLETKGIHYHMAMKLVKRRYFTSVCAELKKKHGADVWFQEWNTSYASAFSYVIKMDGRHYVMSPGHKPLDSFPPGASTDKAIAAKIRATIEKRGPGDGKAAPKKKPRMSPQEVQAIIINYELKTDLQLCAFAEEQESEGKDDLSKWILARPSKKKREEVIETVWYKHNAPAQLARQKKTRIELLRERKAGVCVDGCVDKAWFRLALATLANNQIGSTEFAVAVRELLEKGRGKNRNIYIHGKSNCAKSFLLLPLRDIYHVFSNPSGGSFSWIGANEADVVLLNDIRYSECVMKWDLFLNLLEGAPIAISMPKNHHSADVQWDEDTPILATADAPIHRIVDGIILEAETEMMRNRWRHFHFVYQIPARELVEQKPCGRCFAELVLDC